MIVAGVPTSWEQSTLANICGRGGGNIQTGPFGSQLHASDYVPIGVPSVMPQDIGDNVIREDSIARITLEDSLRLSRYLLEAGDIVYSRRGDVERRALVRPEQEGWLCGTGCLRIRPGSDIHSAYLSYYLGHPNVRQWIKQHAVGATMPNLNTKILGAVPVVTPPLREQRSIAAVLGALDDKIGVNESIAEAAGELARAQMKALWRSLGVTSLTADGAPAGPNVRRTTLGRLCAENGGGIQTGPFGSQLHASEYVESGTPSVMPQNIGDNVIAEDGIARVTASDARRLSKYSLLVGDIVYSRRGDVKRRALVREYESGWLCGTGCLRVRLSGSPAESLFMSQYLGESEVQDWIVQHSVGATMPNLNTSILAAVPVVQPSSQELEKIGAELAPLDARTTQGMHESRTLAALRDNLLPQLMSGKLRVRDAEKIVEDAV
ncbi:MULTISPECIES: restriction endonuclease subunit S [Streptomyces]|uniref:Restriction endonuclease subunit S n=2 Tax=Streptomyces TaxID=1883 RepID=A0ABV9IPZ3_9ACTN